MRGIESMERFDGNILENRLIVLPDRPIGASAGHLALSRRRLRGAIKKG